MTDYFAASFFSILNTLFVMSLSGTLPSFTVACCGRLTRKTRTEACAFAGTTRRWVARSRPRSRCQNRPAPADRVHGIMLQEHLDVPAHVLDWVGRRAGDAAGQERPLEVRPVDGAGEPLVLRERWQTAEVGFDNVGRHWVSA